MKNPSSLSSELPCPRLGARVSDTALGTDGTFYGNGGERRWGTGTKPALPAGGALTASGARTAMSALMRGGVLAVATAAAVVVALAAALRPAGGST